MSDSDMVEIDAALVHETDAAVLLEYGEDEPMWVPKAVCEESEDGKWLVQEWFAYQRGMI